MSYVLELQQLTKRYGKDHGIESVDLTIEKGQIFGFLGPNGAGKTTAIRTIINLLKPTSGAVKVFGLDSIKDAVAINARTGYLSGDFVLYENLTGQQYLDFVANMRNLSGHEERAAALSDLFEAQLTKRISTLSRGNTQKIALIAALLHDPDLLILDEPTTGLDPLMQNRFYELIRDLAKRGKTIFMSSHILSEVQAVCDKVAFMKNGKLVKIVDVSVFQHAHKKEVRVMLAKPSTTFNPGPNDTVEILKKTKQEIRFITEEPAGSLLGRLSKYAISDVSIQDVSLDDVFLKLYGNETRE
jgi:ABC-2 type transport system ATP-binding protein